MRLWGRGGQPSPMATQKEILLLFACGRVYASSIGRWKEASAQRACLWSPAWTWEEGRLGERAVEIHRGSGKTQASSFHLPCGHPIYAVNLEMINTYCYSKDNFNARRSLESHADAFHAHIPVPAAYSRLGGCSADDCPPPIPCTNKVTGRFISLPIVRAWWSRSLNDGGRGDLH